VKKLAKLDAPETIVGIRALRTLAKETGNTIAIEKTNQYTPSPKHSLLSGQHE